MNKYRGLIKRGAFVAPCGSPPPSIDLPRLLRLDYDRRGEEARAHGAEEPAAVHVAAERSQFHHTHRRICSRSASAFPRSVSTTGHCCESHRVPVKARMTSGTLYHGCRQA